MKPESFSATWVLRLANYRDPKGVAPILSTLWQPVNTKLNGTEPDAGIAIMLPEDSDAPFCKETDGRNMSETVALSYL